MNGYMPELDSFFFSFGCEGSYKPSNNLELLMIQNMREKKKIGSNKFWGNVKIADYAVFKKCLIWFACNGSGYTIE